MILAALAAAPFAWAAASLLVLLVAAAVRGIRNHRAPEEG
jgi:hypothetical protein